MVSPVSMRSASGVVLRSAAMRVAIFGEAVVGRLLGEVIVWIDVAVEIGGREDGDFCRLSGEDGRRDCEAK